MAASSSLQKHYRSLVAVMMVMVVAFVVLVPDASTSRLRNCV
ncbi:hypothetical protein ABIB75_007283 [Bradyrhizobium sp. GM2.2]